MAAEFAARSLELTLASAPSSLLSSSARMCSASLPCGLRPSLARAVIAMENRISLHLQYPPPNCLTLSLCESPDETSCKIQLLITLMHSRKGREARVQRLRERRGQAWDSGRYT